MGAAAGARWEEFFRFLLIFRKSSFFFHRGEKHRGNIELPPRPNFSFSCGEAISKKILCTGGAKNSDDYYYCSLFRISQCCCCVRLMIGVDRAILPHLCVVPPIHNINPLTANRPRPNQSTNVVHTPTWSYLLPDGSFGNLKTPYALSSYFPSRKRGTRTAVIPLRQAVADSLFSPVKKL